MRWLGLLAFIATVAPAFAQDNFPDVPENRIQYTKWLKIRFSLEKFGVEQGFRMGYPNTLHDYAEVLCKAIRNLPKTLKRLESEERKSVKSVRTASEWRSTISLYSSDWRYEFCEAIDILDPEIRSLGRNPRSLKKEVEHDQKYANRIVRLLEQRQRKGLAN
jgi:hypothetical protein